MGILDSLPGIIAGAAGTLLFKDITLIRVQRVAGDGRGGYTESKTHYAARGIVTEFSEFKRLVGNLPHNARQAIIQAEGLAIQPRRDDLIDFDGICWKVQEVNSPPGQPIFECVVEATDLSLGSGAILAQINAGLSISLDAIGQNLSGNVVDPTTPRNGSLNVTLDPIQINASGRVLSPRSGGVSQQLQLIAVNAVGDADIGGGVSQQLGSIAMNASGANTISGGVSQTLQPITIHAGATQAIGGAVSQQLQEITTNITGAVDIGGLSAGVLAPITINASGEVDISGGLSQQLSTIQNNVSGDVDIVGSAAASLEPVTVNANADADVSGGLSQGLGNIQINASGTVIPVISGSLQQLLGNITINASGTVTDAGGGEPTLAAGVVMAFDPYGTSGGNYPNGIGSHSQAPYQAPIWPVNGSNDAVDSSWDGLMSGSAGSGANNLVIDKSDMDASGVNVANQPRTISFWYKTPDPGSNQFKTIFGQGANWPQFGGSNQGDFGVRVDGNDLEAAFLGTFAAAGSLSSPRTAYMNGAWHHIAIGISDTEKDYYFDGIRKNGTDQTGAAWEAKAINAALMWSNASAVRATTAHDQAGGFSDSRGFDLEIGDIRIYDEKISDADVTALFNDGRAEYDAGPYVENPVFFDDYDRPLEEPQESPNWSLVNAPSFVTVENGILTYAQGGGTNAFIADRVNQTDFYAETVYELDGTSQFSCPIAGRITDENNWIGVRHRTSVQIQTCVNGSFSTIASSSRTLAVGDKVRMEVSGTNCRVLVNDIVEIDWTSFAANAPPSTPNVGSIYRGGVTSQFSSYEAGPLSVAVAQSDVGGVDANPHTKSFASAPAAGSLLVVVAAHGQSAGDNTIADNGSNTGWTQAFNEQTHEANMSWRRGLSLWWKVSDGTEQQITVDYGDGNCELSIFEFDIVGRTPTFGAVDIDPGGTTDTASYGPVERTGLSAGKRLVITVGSFRGDAGTVEALDANFTNMQSNRGAAGDDLDHCVALDWFEKNDATDVSTSWSTVNQTAGSIALLDFTLA